MAFVEYSFYGVSLQRLLRCRVGRDMTKAVTELLAGNTAKHQLGLHRNEPVSNWAKNKKPLSRKAASKIVYLLCLDEVRSPVSESYLSSLLMCSDLGLSRSALGMLKPTGDSRATAGFSCWNDVWNVWVSSLVVVFFFFLSLFSASLPPFFFSRHGSVTVGGGGGGGGHWAVS